MKLTQEHKDVLLNMDVSQWDAIITYCQTVCKTMSERILTQDMTVQNASRILALAKARYDGATALANNLSNAKEALKERDKRPSRK